MTYSPRDAQAPPSRTQALRLAIPGLLLFAGCSGGFGFRSDEEVTGELPIPAGVRRIAFEVPEGDAAIHTARADKPGSLEFRVILRRMADNADILRRLERVPAELTHAEPDSDGVWRLSCVSVPEAILDAAGAHERDGQPAAKIVAKTVLWIPAGIPCEIRSGVGHLQATGRRAPIELRTGSGDVRVEGCNASVLARTGRGQVMVTEQRGTVDVESDRGTLMVYVRELGESLRVHSGDGTVITRLPKNASFRGTARAESGKVKNGFGLPVEQKGPVAVMTGTVADGRCALDVSTQRGYVSIATF